MSEKKRIIFVDDEPRVLDGLRRMLFSMRKEWEMSFATSGQEALETMTKEAFDVVITDMRMPGMNGADLLSKVRELYPQTVRIVLSGQTKRETILRSVTPIHQFLSKPCSVETIKSTLVRAFTLREFLTENRLKQLVSQVESLPSLPAIYHEIMDTLKSESASISDVGKIISKDMGMSAKILQLVNSAFFGLPRHISNPEQAVVLLGIETIKGLVLSVHLFSQFDQSKLKGITIESLWEHSITVGGLAKQIGKIEDFEQKVIDDIFMAGLLHDVGKLILATNFPEEYGSVLIKVADKGENIYVMERQEFGASHGEIGAYLMGLWGLPDTLIMSAAYHHNPIDHPIKKINPVTIVHVSNALTYKMNSEKMMDIVPILDQDYLAEVGVVERLPIWEKVYQEMIKKEINND